MNKEQEEVIEKINKQLIDIKEHKADYCDIRTEDVDIVLNIIKDKDKEIEKLKSIQIVDDIYAKESAKLIKEQQKDLNLYGETEIALNNRIMDLELELKNKDKIIDEIEKYAKEIVIIENYHKHSKFKVKMRRIKEGLTTNYKMVSVGRKILDILKGK